MSNKKYNLKEFNAAHNSPNANELPREVLVDDLDCAAELMETMNVINENESKEKRLEEKRAKILREHRQ